MLADQFQAVRRRALQLAAPLSSEDCRAGVTGEYNGTFTVNQNVLRGLSCAGGHTHASYRNFFPAGARWQFTGIRLAR